MAYTTTVDWDITKHASAQVSVLRRGVRTPVTGGMVQRKQTFSSQSDQSQAAVRTFKLRFPVASKADYNKAVTLWKNSYAGSEGINFTHTSTAYSGSETIIVRMVAAPLMLKKVSHVQYAFEVTLEEMLHSPGV